MRVLLVDDHAIVRSGLRRLLPALNAADVTEATTGAEALLALQAGHFDLITLDLNLPGLGGLVLLQRILAVQPGARVVVLTMHTEPLYAARALNAGARGYVTKNAAPEELLLALRRVAAGGRYVEAEVAQELALQGGPMLRDLTERDLEILRLLAEGQSLQQIGDALGIAYKTVANICSGIKLKLGVTRTADLIRLATQLGV
jgi:two-component system invasion response regulator UvrY